MGQTRTGSNNRVVGDEHEFKVRAGWLRDSSTQSAALTPRCPVQKRNPGPPLAPRALATRRVDFLKCHVASPLVLSGTGSQVAGRVEPFLGGLIAPPGEPLLQQGRSPDGRACAATEEPVCASDRLPATDSSLSSRSALAALLSMTTVLHGMDSAVMALI